MKNALCSLLILASTYAVAQQRPTPSAPNPPVAISELEKAKLESSLKDLVIIQLQYKDTQNQIQQLNNQLQTLQQTFAKKNTDVESLVTDTKKAHKFGDDVTFNKETGQFEKIATPPQPTKK